MDNLKNIFNSFHKNNLIINLKNNKIKILVFILMTTFLIVYYILRTDYKKYTRINESHNIQRTKVNKHALPLIEDNNRYIELQTKHWINKRKNNEICYGILEKDKIVMTKWIEMFKIKAPKVHYYNYHNKFNIEDFYKVINNNRDKNLVIKISHLQSNYGIIIIPKNPSIQQINQLYNKCLEKFKTCFVCNHDKGDSPTNKEIKENKKTSYYELYETIEPGIIIQDFFYSINAEKISRPLEFKILVFGDKIISGIKGNDERMINVYNEARKISKLLGSVLIRVDFFVKKNDNPYIPYLNEISLSPARGIHVPKGIQFSGKLQDYINEVKNYEPVEYSELDKLILESPKRTIPINKYLTDNEWGIFINDKFRF